MQGRKPPSIENRRSPRARWRLRVVFDHDPSLRATTINLSQGGMCVASDFLASPGTEIGGAVILPDGTQANFEARVTWINKVSRQRSLDDKNTMGLDFVIPPGELYDQALAAALTERGGTRMGNPVLPRAPAGATAPRPRPGAGPNERSIPLDVSAAEQAIEIEPAFAAAARLQSAHPTTSPAPAHSDDSPGHKVEPPVAAMPASLPHGSLHWPASPVGLTERLHAIVQPDEVAEPAGAVTLAVAVSWMDRAAMRCVVPVLPPGSVTLGVAASLRLRHDEPPAPGARVVVTAKVVALADDGRQLTFDIEAIEGDRVLARGRLVHAVIERVQM